jgi:hypothetical protein
MKIIKLSLIALLSISFMAPFAAEAKEGSSSSKLIFGDTVAYHIDGKTVSQLDIATLTETLSTEVDGKIIKCDVAGDVLVLTVAGKTGLSAISLSAVDLSTTGTLALSSKPEKSGKGTKDKDDDDSDDDDSDDDDSDDDDSDDDDDDDDSV